jgi:hypothetical protein
LRKSKNLVGTSFYNHDKQNFIWVSFEIKRKSTAFFLILQVLFAYFNKKT